MPDVSKYMIKTSENIKENFPLISYCVWDTEWLNEFQQHISLVNSSNIKHLYSFSGLTTVNCGNCLLHIKVNPAKPSGLCLHSIFYQVHQI